MERDDRGIKALMTNRREFLIGSGAIIAAPAIVKADNIMRVVVPNPRGEVWSVLVDTTPWEPRAVPQPLDLALHNNYEWVVSTERIYPGDFVTQRYANVLNSGIVTRSGPGDVVRGVAMSVQESGRDMAEFFHPLKPLLTTPS